MANKNRWETFSLDDGGVSAVGEGTSLLPAETSEVVGIPAEVAVFSPVTREGTPEH